MKKRWSCLQAGKTLQWKLCLLITLVYLIYWYYYCFPSTYRGAKYFLRHPLYFLQPNICSLIAISDATYRVLTQNKALGVVTSCRRVAVTPGTCLNLYGKLQGTYLSISQVFLCIPEHFLWLLTWKLSQIHQGLYTICIAKACQTILFIMWKPWNIPVSLQYSGLVALNCFLYYNFVLFLKIIPFQNTLALYSLEQD